MLGAGAVAIVRYTGVGLHAEGSTVSGWLWDVVNGASMAGMAVLEAIGILYCFESYAKAQPSRNRNLLMSLIVGMFVSLLLMLTPYVFAASQRHATADVLVVASGFALWLWSFAVAAAPLLVMAAAGVAEVLRVAPVGAQEAQGAADEVQQVVGAMLANFEAKISESMAGFATVSDVRQAFDRMETRFRSAQPDRNSTETIAAQLSGSETWQAQAVAMAKAIKSEICMEVIPGGI